MSVTPAITPEDLTTITRKSTNVSTQFNAVSNVISKLNEHYASQTRDIRSELTTLRAENERLRADFNSQREQRGQGGVGDSMRTVSTVEAFSRATTAAPGGNGRED